MIQSGTESAWECPSCTGICTCAACRRRKDVPGAASSGKGKNGGGAKKRAAAAEQSTEEKTQTPAATAAADPPADSNGHSEANGATAGDTLSVAPTDATAPPPQLSLSPRTKGVHMEYVEGEESPAVIHIARDSIVLPPSYSPRLTPKAENGTPNEPMDVDTAKAE